MKTRAATNAHFRAIARTTTLDRAYCVRSGNIAKSTLPDAFVVMFSAMAIRMLPCVLLNSQMKMTTVPILVTRERRVERPKLKIFRSRKLTCGTRSGPNEPSAHSPFDKRDVKAEHAWHAWTVAAERTSNS